MEKFPPLRQTICEKLVQTLGEIKSGKVYRGVLWILGEYAESVGEIQQTFQEIRKVLGEIPILSSEQRLLDEASVDEEEKKDEVKTESTKPRVLADGTYATETAFTSAASARLEAVKAAAKPPLRSMFISCPAALQFADSGISADPRWRLLHRFGSCLGPHQACSEASGTELRSNCY